MFMIGSRQPVIQGCGRTTGSPVAHPSRQLLRSFLRMKDVVDGMTNFLILRCLVERGLEGRTALVQPAWPDTGH